MLLEQMAQALRLPQPYIQRIARSADHRYKDYTIPKRSGGMRRIEHPSRELKALQRWLLSHIVNRFPVHEAAFAYMRNRSTVGNARRHANSRFLLRVDIEEFFPSLTAAHLRTFLESEDARVQTTIQGWTVPDEDLFVSLVCRFQQLTIGAPTSPALSNALLWSIDQALAALEASHNLRYSRYADDLFFSSNEHGVLFELEATIKDIVEGARLPRGLRINTEKTRHTSKKRRRRVTGLTLTSDGNLSLGRSWKRNLRRLIYRYDDLTTKERATLAGLLAYASSVEPDLINRLVLKYGSSTVDRARKHQAQP